MKFPSNGSSLRVIITQAFNVYIYEGSRSALRICFVRLVKVECHKFRKFSNNTNTTLQNKSETNSTMADFDNKLHDYYASIFDKMDLEGWDQVNDKDGFKIWRKKKAVSTIIRSYFVLILELLCSFLTN